MFASIRSAKSALNLGLSNPKINALFVERISIKFFTITKREYTFPSKFKKRSKALITGKKKTKIQNPKKMIISRIGKSTSFPLMTINKSIFLST